MKLETMIEELGRKRGLAYKAASRLTLYGSGLILSLGTMLRTGCEYAPSQYALPGAQALLTTAVLYANGCDKVSECCESITYCKDDYEEKCEDNPTESQQPWHCITTEDGEEDCCACVQRIHDYESK